MDEHAVSLLEFSRIVEELAGLCLSPMGAALLKQQEILSAAGEIAERLKSAVAFRRILDDGAELPGFDFPEIADLLPKLGKDGLQLEGEELAAIGRCVLSGLKLRRFVLKAGPENDLARSAAMIPDLSTLSRAIFRLVDHQGLLRERQIPSLAAIRERIRRNRDEADKAVRGMLEDPSYRTFWQTTTPTQRDGRLVLPLKTQFKGRVKGIVHEMSASGSTVFVEPLEVVEKNNAIVQEENLYRIEVRRILRELTREVSGHSAALGALVEGVALLDVSFARARYAIIHACCRADSSESMLSLRDARHPLLGGAVVPVTVEAGGDARVLIITGPNTGGKTVTLKTIGLLALMNQFGMEIPAAEGSALPAFDGIYADIGDEQSIQQSLSTFSAHVKNISGIVQAAGRQSLVLLDELGAGTDPEEGVALAMALLDDFLQKGCIVITTTHHGILKNYGATRRGAQNASMGFDTESFAPTYRILMGVPGESHAIEIARRSGMPDSILSSAISYLNDERTDISRLVSSLAERHQKLTLAEEQQRTREHDLREKRRSTDLKELTLRQKELELRRHGLRDLRDFLSQVRKEWESLRDRVPAGESSDVGKFVEGVQRRIEQEEDRIARERESLLPDQSMELHEGMEVIIRRSGRRGRVVRRDKGRRWIVETETIRLSVLPGEVRAAPAADAPAVTVSYTPAEPLEPPVMELHIRGMRLDEAMRLVEKQLDSALVHGLRQFSIVHGKGEGILRRAIHEYLRSLPAVEDFRFSPPEEGGYGKTIVTLKG
ncbi:MAG TPA: endonuclease MutS2 [Spirochaetia bacterium]|nr:endonuclease MutS2 [Spirochaetia bacterium]